MDRTDRITCADERTKSSSEFEVLLSDVTTTLLAAPPEQVEAVAAGCLERVRAFLAVDGCALVALDEDRRTVSACLAAAGASPVDGPVDLARHFPWSWRQLTIARAPVCVDGLAVLPAEASADHERLSRLGVRSALAVPLEASGGPDYVIVAHTVHEERRWSDVAVSRLRLLGELLVCALKRHDMVLKGRETAEQLRLAVESGEAGLWSLDLATGALWGTPRARAIFGFSQDETLTVDRFWALVHPDDRALVEDAMRRATAVTGPTIVEYRVVGPGEGEVRWISSRGSYLIGCEGWPVLMGISLDISQRKLAQQALEESEARLAAGAELAELAFYDVDWRAGGIPYADARMRGLLGVAPEGELGVEALEFWLDHVHPDDRATLVEMRGRLLEGEADKLSLEYRYLHPERGETWLHQLAAISARDADGRAMRTHGVYRDITAFKRVEGELRDLSCRLITAHEEERALLARELHDDLSQRLAVLAIEAGRAELADPAGPAAGALSTLREGLVRISEDVHSLAYQLHPSLLEELGLAEALRAECEHRCRRQEFEINIDVPPLSCEVDRDVALCLFRVAQEALTNSARHAQATEVTVTLRQVDDGLLLAVADDGVGFAPDEQAAVRHLGLASMRERARLVNGTLDVESAPGLGTTVVVWAPFDGALQ